MLSTTFRSCSLFTITAVVVTLAAGIASADDTRRGHKGRGGYHAAQVTLEAPGLSPREARSLRGTVLVERAELQADVRALESRIRSLRDISEHARPRLRGELCHQISAMEADLARLRDRVRSAHRVDVRLERRGEWRHARLPHAASPAEFHSIKRSVKSSPYSADQLLTLTAIAKRTHFTTAQARELASIFVYSNHRLDALVLLYPQVVDPQNYHETYSLLTYSNDRRKLMRRIGVI